MSEAENLRLKAATYRALAAEARDPDACGALIALAEDFEAEAERAESGPRPASQMPLSN